MSKRCELQKEYYKEFGNYKGDGKYTDHYVNWLESRVLEITIPVVSQQRELLSDLIDFSNNNAPPVIQKGLKQVILEFNQSLNCG